MTVATAAPFMPQRKQKIQIVFACLCALRMFFPIVILLHPQKNRHLPEKQMPICVTLFYA